MLSSWRMYEMHLALFLKAGCYNYLTQKGNHGVRSYQYRDVLGSIMLRWLFRQGIYIAPSR
jgi:hypothetical protein